MMETVYGFFDSPIGQVTISAESGRIVGLHIAGDRYFTRVPDYWIAKESEPVLQRAVWELGQYFAGRSWQFDLPIMPSGTVFQQRVWHIIKEVPMGSAITYSQIAQKINQPQAARAVGTAVGRNPICLFIPCHRVVASDGSLGGYVAGLERKEQLLRLEGVDRHSIKN